MFDIQLQFNEEKLKGRKSWSKDYQNLFRLFKNSRSLIIDLISLATSHFSFYIFDFPPKWKILDFNSSLSQFPFPFPNMHAMAEEYRYQSSTCLSTNNCGFFGSPTTQDLCPRNFFLCLKLLFSFFRKPNMLLLQNLTLKDSAPLYIPSQT